MHLDLRYFLFDFSLTKIKAIKSRGTFLKGDPGTFKIMLYSCGNDFSVLCYCVYAGFCITGLRIKLYDSIIIAKSACSNASASSIHR